MMRQAVQVGHRVIAARSGLTLLEIVISISIFFGAMVALSQLARNGAFASVQARLKTQAAIRCEAKLNELVAGIETMGSHSGVSFPDDSKWTWSSNVVASEFPELVQLEVTVSHRGTSRLATIDVVLRRWVRLQSSFAAGAAEYKAEDLKKHERIQYDPSAN